MEVILFAPRVVPFEQSVRSVLCSIAELSFAKSSELLVLSLGQG